MKAYLLVAIGSALGGVLRFWLGEFMGGKLGAMHLDLSGAPLGFDVRCQSRGRRRSSLSASRH